MIEALSVGATTAVKLVAFVVVNLIAFFAVLNFLDAMLSYFGAKVNCPELSFQVIRLITTSMERRSVSDL